MNDAAKLKMSNKSVRKRFEQISRESRWSPGNSHLRVRKDTGKNRKAKSKSRYQERKRAAEIDDTGKGGMHGWANARWETSFGPKRNGVQK